MSLKKWSTCGVSSLLFALLSLIELVVPREEEKNSRWEARKRRCYVSGEHTNSSYSPQANQQLPFVCSIISYAQCSACDDHWRRYIHLICSLTLTRESFYRLVIEEKEKNTCLWDVTRCILYKNKRTHLERNKRAIKRNKCCHWYQFLFHIICLNLFLGTSENTHNCSLFFFRMASIVNICFENDSIE